VTRVRHTSLRSKTPIEAKRPSPTTRTHRAPIEVMERRLQNKGQEML
jgi:hypothetical protein